MVSCFGRLFPSKATTDDTSTNPPGTSASPDIRFSHSGSPDRRPNLPTRTSLNHHLSHNVSSGPPPNSPTRISPNHHLSHNVSSRLQPTVPARTSPNHHASHCGSPDLRSSVLIRLSPSQGVSHNASSGFRPTAPTAPTAPTRTSPNHHVPYNGGPGPRRSIPTRSPPNQHTSTSSSSPLQTPPRSRTAATPTPEQDSGWQSERRRIAVMSPSSSPSSFDTLSMYESQQQELMRRFRHPPPYSDLEIVSLSQDVGSRGRSLDAGSRAQSQGDRVIAEDAFRQLVQVTTVVAKWPLHELNDTGSRFMGDMDELRKAWDDVLASAKCIVADGLGPTCSPKRGLNSATQTCTTGAVTPRTLGYTTSTSEAAEFCAQLNSGNRKVECVICAECYKADEEIRLFPCRHFAHKSCADEWLGRCPRTGEKIHCWNTCEFWDLSK